MTTLTTSALRAVRGGLAAVLVALVTVAAPGLAAPTPALTLLGSRSAYADWTVTARTTFDLTRATLQGKGRFVGLYIEAIDRPVADRSAAGRRLGAIQMRDYHTPGAPAEVVGIGGTSGYLEPGRYRVYLVADGTAVVRVPMSGSRSTTLRPNHVTNASGVAKANIAANPVEASNRQPMSVAGQRVIAFASITIGPVRAFAGQIEACLTTTGQDCGKSTPYSADGTYTGWILSPLADRDFSFTIVYEPGLITSATYDAVQAALNAATIQYATGAAFALTLH